MHQITKRETISKGGDSVAQLVVHLSQDLGDCSLNLYCLSFNHLFGLINIVKIFFGDSVTYIELFIILVHPVDNSVTVFSNLTKLNNDDVMTSQPSSLLTPSFMVNCDANSRIKAI